MATHQQIMGWRAQAPSIIQRLSELNDTILDHIKAGDVADSYPLIPERNRLRQWVKDYREVVNRYNLKAGRPIL